MRVVSTKGKVKQFDEDFKTSKDPVDDKLALAVLINRGSASASEIVAGAIQDLDRGVIVGQRSYGKGLVQITRPLSYNTQLKVTTREILYTKRKMHSGCRFFASQPRWKRRHYTRFADLGV